MRTITRGTSEISSGHSLFAYSPKDGASDQIPRVSLHAPVAPKIFPPVHAWDFMCIQTPSPNNVPPNAATCPTAQPENNGCHASLVEASRPKCLPHLRCCACHV
ncbi:unnamed protein product [Prunus armeniaca]|uniref:Uncharacterized protein n=1 Tax=Prunus armeniaca TaxID=36596 RepID=A0A6J5WKW6_PRUAR|nr:unnamed protein product [Prunus armeniaca]CAB4300705.1 unnamed protein product [Prunus armeniaca]